MKTLDFNYTNMMDDFDNEDVYTLRKAIELNYISSHWDQGMLLMPRLDMLAKEFRYDALLQKLNKYMQSRVQEFLRGYTSIETFVKETDFEMLFADQPLLYNENVTKEKPWPVLYDVNKCFYKKRLLKKYPKYNTVIELMIQLA